MMESVLPLGNDSAAMSALPLLSAKLGSNANVNAAAQDFEAMFATQLLKPMFDTIPVNGVFGGGHGEEIMRTFMLQEYGKMIAKTGCLGIAPQVKREMLRAQEAAKARGASFAPANYRGANANIQSEGSAYVSSR
jgi:Rod binding domain-containing protein